MNNIVRAWKDESYRQSLSAEEQVMLPTNPAGEIELNEAALESVQGACGFSGHSSGDSHRVSQDGSNNTINQDVDQSATATFGNNNFVIDSFVQCRATNDADLCAQIKDRNLSIH